MADLLYLLLSATFKTPKKLKADHNIWWLAFFNYYYEKINVSVLISRMTINGIVWKDWIFRLHVKDQVLLFTL